MKSFLNQVASHYGSNSTELLKQTVFILPNRRSLIHFKEEMRALIGFPAVKETSLISINDFLQKVNGVHTSDRIELLLVLYECYKSLNPQAESLDNFLHWGKVIISDFDNVDKYMVDADALFCNVAEFKEMEDTYEYLTQEQRSAIKHFVSHFWDKNGRLTVRMDGESKDVKSRFLKIWNMLAPLYASYKEALGKKGLAYEGMVYRSVAESIRAGRDIKEILNDRYEGKSRFVFIGLNALNECEKTILRAVRDAGMGEYVWDFCSKEIRDKRNRASFFLSKNVEEFPQAVPIDTQGLKRPAVKVIGVPSTVGQTKLAAEVLKGCAGKPEDTAFVLPDESLLMPLLSAIPMEYDTINVTMGYPMDKSAIYNLVRSVMQMNLTVRNKEDNYYYYYKTVANVLSAGLFRSFVASLDGQSKECQGDVDDVKSYVETVRRGTRQYIPVSELSAYEALKPFFQPLTISADSKRMLNPSDPSTEQNRAICSGLKTLVGSLLLFCENADSDVLQVEADFCRRYLEALDIIDRYELPVLPGTWFRILDGLVRGESVPFEGDALKGLQVMGTLETRALDFRNVCIFNVNEDIFPHRSVDSSFIPPELRKGFGMPTTEYQDAVWAYYFYRLIQRAENVWLIYDTRKEGMLSGEESRYIKQLRYHFNFNLDEYAAVSPLAPVAEDEGIEKTEEDIKALKEYHLSASSLQSYLSCPVKFYYQAVKRLKAEDEVAESLDAAMLGTIFHALMQKLYDQRGKVTKEDILNMLSDEASIRTMARSQIIEQMNCLDVEGRNLVIEQVLVEYVKATLRHDLDILQKNNSAGFRIIGLERYVKTTIEGFPFIGFIDRIDSYKDGEVRIVDYKTGHVEDEDINITDDNAVEVADKLFGESNVGRPQIALQMWLYDKFAATGLLRPGEKLVNSIYATNGLLTNPLPDMPESPAFIQEVDGRIKLMLEEIADTNRPWTRTSDKKSCATCDFRAICGR